MKKSWLPVFQAAKQAVYDDYLLHKAFQQEIERVDCSSVGFERLHDITKTLHRELNKGIEEGFELAKSVFASDVLKDPRFLFSYVAGALYRCHLGAQTGEEFRSGIFTELDGFLDLLVDLINHHANTRRIFFVALLNPEVSMQGIWQAWEAKYDLVVRRVQHLKKTLRSHRNRIRSYSEVSDDLKAAVEKEYETILERLDSVAAKDWLKDKQLQYGSPGGHPRKQHKVWLPVLRDLEKELVGKYVSQRYWEMPGGFPQKATPGAVYETMNKILHYCHPGIWDLDANATASIKSRCQRFRST